MVVHRLDQATSGLVVFAKHEGALKSLHAQLREKAAAAREAGGGPAAVEKGYTALVSCARGPLDPPEGRITLPVRKDMENAPKQVGQGMGRNPFVSGVVALSRSRFCLHTALSIPESNLHNAVLPPTTNLRWWTWTPASPASPSTACVAAAPIGASSGCSR